MSPPVQDEKLQLQQEENQPLLTPSAKGFDIESGDQPVLPSNPRQTKFVCACVKEKRRLHRIRFLVAGVILYILLKSLVKFHRFVPYVKHVTLKGCKHEVTSASIPEGITLVNCTSWNSSAQFDLPLSSNKLFLLSRGPYSAGSIDIVQDNSYTGDKVLVDVTHRHSHDHDHDHKHKHKHKHGRDHDHDHDHKHKHGRPWVKVCKVQGPDEGENGVGIFTHEHSKRRRRHHIHKGGFRVTVHLPSSDKGPVQVSNFETDMPLFVHKVHDLEKGVEFGQLSISAALMPISVESVRAQSVTVKTTNNPISGTFNVTDSLTLSTVNSPIRVNVSLHQSNKEDAKESTVTLSTMNAPLRATFGLYAGLTAEAGTGGSYNIKATTGQSPLELQFIEAPVDSSLHLQASTSFSPANVRLHETYEGRFKLTTLFSRPQISEPGKDKEDPAGRGRSRIVTWNETSNTVEGKIVWVDEDGKSDGEERGFVDLTTSFATPRLQV